MASMQTLYNYFPDLENVLGAWMEQEADMVYPEIREKTASLENPPVATIHLHRFFPAIL